MRSIEIQTSRSVKRDELLPAYQKNIPADYKGDTFPFSAGPVDTEVPATLDEAIQVLGKDKVFDYFMRQLRTDLQNDLAQKILDKVTDPKKTSRRSGKAIQVEL